MIDKGGIIIFNIIVSGHGNFADGMKSCVEFILGQNENIHYVNFNGSMGTESLTEAFNNIIDKIGKQNQILFLTDLVGATPFNTAVLLSTKNPNIKVIGGANIPALIEAVQKVQEDSLDTCLAEIISSGKKSLGTIEIINNFVSNTNKEDGI